jgi:superoxide reductase
MNNRRNFLKMAVPAGAVSLLASGCESTPASLPGNIVYSEANQGVWQGKAGSHAPVLTTAGDQGVLETKHGMSPAHYIVRHTIVTEAGEVIFSNTFSYDDKEAKSTFELSLLKKGQKYIALSYCNKHDLWMSEVSV